jgi:hypothetical protein
VTAGIWLTIILGAVVVTGQQLWRSPKMRGIFGEYYVRSRLRKLDDRKYKLIHNVTLRHKSGKLSQIDHIVVSPYGVFVIETKNYRGKIYGTEYSEDWTRYIGKSKWTFYNPVKQNNGHVQALRTLLGSDVNFISVVCFLGQADIEKVVAKSADVVYAGNLRKTLKKYQELTISISHMEEIVAKIESNALRGSDISKEHAEYVKTVTTERFERELREPKVLKMVDRKPVVQVEKSTCPRCGTPMVEREGKNGKGLVCSKFSRCKA